MSALTGLVVLAIAVESASVFVAITVWAYKLYAGVYLEMHRQRYPSLQPDNMFAEGPFFSHLACGLFPPLGAALGLAWLLQRYSRRKVEAEKKLSAEMREVDRMLEER